MHWQVFSSRSAFSKVVERSILGDFPVSCGRYPACLSVPLLAPTSSFPVPTYSSVAHSSFGILYIHRPTDVCGHRRRRRGKHKKERSLSGGQMNIWPAYCDTCKEPGKNQPNALGRGRPRRRREQEGGKHAPPFLLHDPRTYAMHAARARRRWTDERTERASAHGK